MESATTAVTATAMATTVTAATAATAAAATATSSSIVTRTVTVFSPLGMIPSAKMPPPSSYTFPSHQTF